MALEISSGLRPAATKQHSELRDGCQSRAFGPRLTFKMHRGMGANLGPSALENTLSCLEGWMHARAFGPSVASGLRPSPPNSSAFGLGPSALKTLLPCLEWWMEISGLRPSKIRCLPTMDGCSCLRPSHGGPPARRLGAFGPQTSYTQNFDLL